MKLAAATMTAAVMMSCNPKVAVDLMGNYPARDPNQVLIYEQEDSVPGEATVVGKVKVTDSGMTIGSDCLYGNMLALAVKKTAESGGNALHIDKHKNPDFVSSCHRVWGTMLLLPDHYVEQAGTMNTLEKMERIKDEELLGLVHEQIERTQRARQTPRNVVKVSGGLSILTSDFQMFDHIYKNSTGYAIDAAYHHLWGFIGTGVDFSHAAYSFESIADISVNYVGPSLVLSGMMDKRSLWRWDVTLSLGYGWYTEEYRKKDKYTEGHFSAKANVGIEYKVARHVGLGLQMGMSTLKLDKPENYKLKDNEFYGIQHLDILGGLRFYF